MFTINEFYGFKNWFRPEVAERFRVYGYEILSVSKETEKAICFEAYCDEYSENFNIWAPKSALTTKEEVEAEKEINEKMNKNWKNGLEYNEALKQFCIENGIKVRERNTTQTLKKKLNEADLMTAFKEKYDL